MTLVVGILCQDAVVIGADSAMTFANSRQATIEQPYPNKITIIQDNVIIAGAGEIGLGQRFVETTGKLWRENKLKGLSSVEIGRMLSSTAVADFKSTRLDQVDYGALVALPRERPQLIEFSHGLFQPEVKSEANWYVSIGSGQTVADPLLGFVRKTFWGDERPTKSEGIFAAAMVLTLACEMAPSGVALPIRMAVLGSDKKARELTDDELQEHREHVDGALQHFKAYRDSPPSDQPLPTAPKKTQ